MSRIHEALKKAEQEKGIRRPGETTGIVSPGPAIPDPAGLLPTDAPSLTVHAAQTSEIPTLESLTRIAASKWKPDPNGVVAFQGGHGKLGTEEFRSLR